MVTIVRKLGHHSQPLPGARAGEEALAAGPNVRLPVVGIRYSSHCVVEVIRHLWVLSQNMFPGG
jgi:hypothetical protein